MTYTNTKLGQGNKINISFLFGAGAETGNNFNLPSGFEYQKQTILGTNKNSITDGLKKYFSQSYFQNFKYEKRIFDPSALLNNFIISRINNENEFYLLGNKIEDSFISNHWQIINKILTNQEMKELRYDIESTRCDLGYLFEEKNTDSESENVKSLLNEFLAIISGDLTSLDKINSIFLRDLFSESTAGNIEFYMSIGLGGLLDNYFHTIINPKKYGPYKFNNVFNYYWFCYFSIIEGILKYLKSANNDYYLDHFVENNFITNANAVEAFEIIANIEEFTKRLYGIDVNVFSSFDNYYSLIAQALYENKALYNLIGVATTNYYKFTDIIYHKNNNKQNTIFLNGSLNLFEYPELLEIRDLSKNVSTEIDSNNLFFPFIFGQSLIKPIVSSTQIKEFNRFRKMLRDSDCLVILGYNINEDDNHINAFIRDFVENKKHIFIVQKQRNIKLIQSKLRTKKHEYIHSCNVTSYKENSVTVNTIFEEIQNIMRKNRK